MGQKKSLVVKILMIVYLVTTMLFYMGCNRKGNSLETADNVCCHNYTIEYSWQGYSKCKGIATCNNCNNIVEENATVIRAESPSQTHSCSQDEVYLWTAIFSNEIFENVSKFETTLSASHSYIEGEPIWSRDLDNKEYCRIPKSCSECGHEESIITYDITKTTTPATCTENGKIEYFAVFDNGRTATKVTEIIASHDYSLQYFWDKENDRIVSCRAYKICARCSSESENHKIFVEEISVDKMQKVYVENEENCYYYIANFKTYGLSPQTSEKFYEHSSNTNNNENESNNENEQQETDNLVKEIVNYSAVKNANGFFDIYFQDTIILQNTTAIVEGTTFKLIGCEISFEDGDFFYFIDEESFVQFEISSQDEDSFALNYIHYEPIYVYGDYKITNGDNVHNSYIEFYTDKTACLFVNILEDIYFPFLPFNNWEIDQNNKITIYYLEQVLQFTLEN